VVFAVGGVMMLTGCASPPAFVAPPFVPTVSSVVPSGTGVPNSVTSLGSYEFVSVQGTGQIFSYNISSGSQVLAVAPYTTPCSDPSGMVIASIGGANVMAVACYDTGSMLTLTVRADGSLTPLGSVSGLGAPCPGIAFDGTNVLLPICDGSGWGFVAKVSIASPASPAITGMVTLGSPSSGEFANPGFLAVSGGNIFVSAGSEFPPADTTSTIQVVNEATMSLIGSPLVVAHSPQWVAVQGSVLYAAYYDASQLQSIDISDPTNLKSLQIVSLATAPSCHGIPIVVRDNMAYVGCYAESVVEEFDVSNPSSMKLVGSFTGIAGPEDFNFAARYRLGTGAVGGGSVYAIDTGAAQ
jgi:hypothetical protein